MSELLPIRADRDLLAPGHLEAVAAELEGAAVICEAMAKRAVNRRSSLCHLWRAVVCHSAARLLRDLAL